MSDLPRHLQLLWDREPAGRRGPKPGCSITEIGQAAVAIADAEGLGAISMKGVAQAVGLTTMSLYRYVDSKEQLLAVMLDVALQPPALAHGRRGWRSLITLWALEIARVRLAHPWSDEVVQHEPLVTPNALAWMEAGRRALEDTPLSDQERWPGRRGGQGRPGLDLRAGPSRRLNG